MGIAVTLTGLLAKLKIITVAGILSVLSSGLILFTVVEGVNIVLLSSQDHKLAIILITSLVGRKIRSAREPRKGSLCEAQRINSIHLLVSILGVAFLRYRN